MADCKLAFSSGLNSTTIQPMAKNLESKLNGLIKAVEDSVEEFNKIHVEHIPGEAPASAMAARLRIEVKHMRDTAKNILIESNGKQDNGTEK